MINGMLSIKNPSCSLLLHNETAPKLRVVIDLKSNKDCHIEQILLNDDNI